MTNQQILEKAIQKAIDGGWKFDIKNSVYYAGAGAHSYAGGHWQELIFNHDFAKALWGDVPEWSWGGFHASDGQQLIGPPYPNWLFRLQQMVIADDPIKYLGDNI